MAQSTPGQPAASSSLRIVRNLLRLGSGARAFALAAAQRRSDRPRVLSSDVFATLIARTSDDHAARRAGNMVFLRAAAEAGLSCPADVRALRRACEAEQTAAYRARGLDPDFTNLETYRAMALRLGAAAPELLSERAAAAEAEWEGALTKPVPELHAWYRESVAAGERVIAVSDTKFSGTELTAILHAHGYEGLAGVYVSADHAACKFSGRLFDVVAEAEAVAAHEIDHRGDNWLADVLAPAQRGVRVRRVPPPVAPKAAELLPQLPLPAESAMDLGHSFGFTTLGPVFAAFVRLVLAEAYADGVTHLAFVARDGDLPLEVARILVEALPEAYRPRLSYVYLSRRGLRDVSTPAGEVTAKGEQVLRYLDQAGVLDEGTALVDIGWRGSIHEQVCALATARDKACPRAYYLALWNEDALPGANAAARGVLGDQRRNRGPREGAAWYCALLLEGVSRADHGTVIGYTEDAQGQVQPELAVSGQSREAEVEAQGTQCAIRAGVLAYARALAAVEGIAAPPDVKPTRLAAQWVLFNLAFFPGREARAVGRQLVHSESTDDFMAMLVQPRGKGLTGGLRSLRSPWKGAGFREVGGLAGALAYLLVETAFCYLPLGLKTRLRERMAPPPNDAAVAG